MPYTVAGAFDLFRQNYVDLDAIQTSQARNSRNYLLTQLQNIANTSADFPMINHQLFGSFSRKTKIRPLDDIDVMVVLKGTGTTSTQKTYGSLEYALQIDDKNQPLAKFADSSGYFVNSTRILNRIRDYLSDVSNYQNSFLNKRMESVVLNLKSYPWSFDIVPSVPIGHNGTTEYYLIPNGYGNWIRTDPRKDTERITSINQKHLGKFLPTMRLLKYWNSRTHKPKLPSYYFETLVYNVFCYAPLMSSYQNDLRYFFNNATTYLLGNCPDPKNLGPALDEKIDYTTKSDVATAIYTAKAYVSATITKNDRDSMLDWQGVFGSNFPTYG